MQAHSKRSDIFHPQPNPPNENQPLPRFLQAGLSFLQKYENVRRQGFQQRLIVADLLKTRGNALFKEERTREACLEYEQGLSIFRYVLLKANDLESKTGQRYEYVDFEGEKEDERLQVRNLKVVLYNNLAAVYLKLNDFESARAACDAALVLDPKQTKALYRRAKAITSLPEVKYEDYSSAYENLKLAVTLSPNDANIVQLMTKIKAEITKLVGNNQFKGIFNQPKKPSSKTDVSEENNNNNTSPKAVMVQEVQKIEPKVFTKSKFDQVQELLYANQDCEEKCLDYLLCFEVDPYRPPPEGVADLEKFMEEKGTEVLTFFEKVGQFDQAKEVRDTLKKAKDAKKRIEKFSSLNLEKPTPYFKKAAEKYGLEANDPLIRREFERLQHRSLEELRNLFLLLCGKRSAMLQTPKTDHKIKKESSPKESTSSSFLGNNPSFLSSNNNTNNTAITTNNYYINNNFYGSFPEGEKLGEKAKKFTNLKEHQTHFPSQEVQQKMLSDLLQNVTTLNEAKGSLKVTRIMNFVIIIVALLLVLFTFFIQTKDSPSQSSSLEISNKDI